MKLIILPILFSVVWANMPPAPLRMVQTQDCCPCGTPVDNNGPPDNKATVIFVVDTPNSDRGKPKELIQQLIIQLIKREIIDAPTANQLANAFGVPLPPGIQVVTSFVPLSPATIPNLPIGGRPDAAKPFKIQLISLVQTPVSNEAKEPTLIKVLLELLLNNRVPTLQVIKTTVEYNIYPIIHVVTVEPGKQPPPLVFEPGKQPPPLVIEPGKKPPPLVVEPGKEPPPLVIEPGKKPPPLVIEPGREPPPLVIEPGKRPPPPLVIEPGREPPLLVVEPGRKPPPLVIEPGREPPPLVIEPGKRPPPPLVIEPGRIPPPLVIEPGKKPPPPLVIEPGREPPPLVIEPGKRPPPPLVIEPGRVPPPLVIEPGRVPPPLVNEPGKKPPPPLVIEPGRVPPPLVIEPGRTPPSLIIEPGRTPPPLIVEPGRTPPPLIVESRKTPPPLIIENAKPIPPLTIEPGKPVPPLIIETKKTPPPLIVETGRTPPPLVIVQGTTPIPSIIQIVEPPPFPVNEITPGQPGTSTVIITTIEDRVVPPAVNKLLEILVIKKIIEPQVASNILITYGIKPQPPLNPDGIKLTPDQLSKIPIGIGDQPRQNFIINLIELLKTPQPSKPTLIKIFITFLLDNGIVDLPTIQKFLITYNIIGKLNFQPQPAEPVFPIDLLPPGEPGQSTLTLTTVEPNLTPSVINKLLEILVIKKVITAPTANSILSTFDVPGRNPFNPAGVQKLTTQTVSTIQVVAPEETRDKFLSDLTNLIPQPSHPQLIKILLTFLLDSGTINLQTAQRFLTIYKLGGRLEFQPIPPVVEPVLEKGVEPGNNMIIDSTVTVTGNSRPLKPLIKRLVELVVKANLLTPQIGDFILTTFGITAPIQTGGPIPTIQLNVGGRPGPAEKFKNNFASLLIKPSTASHPTLVKILTELLIDNLVVHHTSAVKLLAAYGVSTDVKIQFTPAKGTVPAVTTPVKEPKLQPGQPPRQGLTIDSIVTVTTTTRPLPPLIKRLIQLCVEKTLLTQEIANNILVTFGIDAPGGVRLTQESVDNLAAIGIAEAWQKFIKTLTPLLSNPSTAQHTAVIEILSELLIDNASFSHNSVSQLLVAYGVGVKVEVQYITTEEQDPVDFSFLGQQGK